MKTHLKTIKVFFLLVSIISFLSALFAALCYTRIFGIILYILMVCVILYAIIYNIIKNSEE